MFCIYQTNGESYCLEINYNEAKIYYHPYQLKCRNRFYAMKVNYFPETDEFAFSCITQEGGVQIQFFDKDFNGYQKVYKFTECGDIYGYSILYSNSDNKYYILSDVNCQGEYFPY